jgi:uncharacterized cofD-like protein
MKRLKFLLLVSLGIKRWLLLFAVGVLVAGLGSGILLAVVFQGEIHSFLSLASGRYLNLVEVFYIAIAVLLTGILISSIAFRYIMNELFQIVGLPEPNQAMDSFLKRRLLARGPRIVALGGGTGLPILLQGIKHFSSNITAIVTVADDGGSSGKLREDFGMLPPGDIRNCLLALAERESQLEGILRYRFKGEGDLARHSLGNLILTALTEQKGDFLAAVTEASRLLATLGRVVPMSLANVHLVGAFADGLIVRGESKISKAGGHIERLSLDPPNPPATPEALEAILEADLILYAPGSLFTSLIPNLLVPEIRMALSLSKAPRVLICNTMTQPGETEAFTEADHLQAVLSHAGKIVDYAIINAGDWPSAPAGGYNLLNRYLGRRDYSDIGKMGVSCFFGSVADLNRPYRHDSMRLAETVARLFVTLRPEFRRYLWFDDEM